MKEVHYDDEDSKADFEIPLASFRLLALEIAEGFMDEVRFSKQALEALQEETESMLVQLYRDAKLCSFHRRSATVGLKDLLLTKTLNRDIRHWCSSPSCSFDSYMAYCHHESCGCLLSCGTESLDADCKKILHADRKADEKYTACFKKCKPPKRNSSFYYNYFQKLQSGNL